MEQALRSPWKWGLYFLCLIISLLSLAILLAAAGLLLYYALVLVASVYERNLPAVFGKTVGGETTGPRSTKPNIVIISVDDLGWNDVSFHGYSQISTPNIDRLAHEGVILNSFYAQSACTPSRSALMTARYPIRYGLQHDVIRNGEPRGLPVSEKILPQYLKELGYSTHLFGKWHLGYYQTKMLPTSRGFDSFFGCHGPSLHHFNHTFTKTGNDDFHGLDLWNDTEPARNLTGQYITHVLTDVAVQRIAHHNFVQVGAQQVLVFHRGLILSFSRSSCTCPTMRHMPPVALRTWTFPKNTWSGFPISRTWGGGNTQAWCQRWMIQWAKLFKHWSKERS
ncbi:hypothetical protein RvY_11510-2 [Ramazzottius varieornatus]|uniref:Sulfatase N-terminal domain-containing protein n=1 Tax=Ramazzottius varieornatus TaxID=947166 RepID=A0A1D1VQ66_RAMVA|nr:hypothetical protein RvY_11510-2 [Ramazzottius varieornatus]